MLTKRLPCVRRSGVGSIFTSTGATAALTGQLPLMCTAKPATKTARTSATILTIFMSIPREEPNG